MPAAGPRDISNRPISAITLHTIQPYLARALVDWSLRRGYSAGWLATRLNIPTLDLLSQADCRLSALQYEGLLSALYDEGHASLGVDIGQQLTVSSYGVLGHAMQTAETVGDAVQLGLSFYRLTSNFMTLQSRWTPQGLCLEAFMDYELPALGRFAPEEHLAGICQIARQLIGQAFTPLSVSLPAQNADALSQFLGCPVATGSNSTCFTIAHSLLERGLPYAHALTSQQLRRICQQLADEEEDQSSPVDLRGQVRQILTQTDPLLWPDLPALARSLSTTERTLRRRLSEQGTDYRREQDRERQKRAEWLLENSKLSVEAISAQLGYGEVASFRRAFHRWHGQSPRQRFPVVMS